MNKTLIILFFLCFNLFSKTNDVKYRLDSLSLLGGSHHEQIEFILDSLYMSDSIRNMSTLYQYAKNVDVYREIVIEILIKKQNSKSLELLDQYRDSLYFTQWRSIGQTLKKNPWKLKEFHEIFFQVLNTSQDEEVRNKICGYFNKNALYEDLEKLRTHLKVEPNSFARMNIFSAHARYSDSITNAIIIKWFNEFEEPHQLDFLIDNGICYNNRHDLIPELKKFRARLVAIKDVKKMGDAKMLINTIDRALPDLNKNKPAGKPLDWGHDY